MHMESGQSAGSPREIRLPPGVAVGPGRETTQTNLQGQVVQGMVFPITLPNGTTTSVFTPYSMLGNTDAVRALFADRVSAIMAITGT